ncbi:MAG: alpha/beta hydrolase [Syntrophobacterales bacterium]|nr:alpha/beta hydrolase [Syntrophobacterales bacterium]
MAVSADFDTRKQELPVYHPFRSEKARERYLSLYDRRASLWPIPYESKMADTSYGRTFVRVSGPDGALPLVLLPGATSSSLMWAPNIKVLSENFKTYAVDNIYDFGRSVYTRAIRDEEDFAYWLNEFFDALGLGANINLVGMSYGGWIASQYALRFSNRLHKIVLLAPARTVLHFRPSFVLRVPLALLPWRFTVRRFVYWIFEEFARRRGEADVILENVVDDMLAGFQCFKPKRFVQPTVLKKKELRNLKVPMLYMIGEYDKLYSARKAVRRLNKISARIKTEIIPDADHALTIACAEIVNQKILDFLRSS